MDNASESHLHPIDRAGALESRMRRLLQNPHKIMRKHIRPGMTVLDLGCGTGYFTTAIADLLGTSGKVVAAEVQQGMLDILRQKLNSSPSHQRIQIYPCTENHLGLTDKFDFVLAFYAFHEMRYIDSIIPELKTLLNPGAKILIAEQYFHVPKAAFAALIQKMENHGFVICQRPRIFFSRAVVMKL